MKLCALCPRGDPGLAPELSPGENSARVGCAKEGAGSRVGAMAWLQAGGSRITVPCAGGGGGHP